MAMNVFSVKVCDKIAGAILHEAALLLSPQGELQGATHKVGYPTLHKLISYGARA